MPLRFALFALCLLVCSCSAGPSIGGAQQQASLNWLKLIDNRAYNASWEASAPLFQKAISKQNWVRQIASVRSPMGLLISRKLTSADARENLTGQPEGIYTIFIYRSSFAGKNQVLETHTVFRADGSQPWRNAGYSIK